VGAPKPFGPRATLRPQALQALGTRPIGQTRKSCGCSKCLVTWSEVFACICLILPSSHDMSRALRACHGSDRSEFWTPISTS